MKRRVAPAEECRCINVDLNVQVVHRGNGARGVRSEHVGLVDH
jgi:hypothetical protein